MLDALAFTGVNDYLALQLGVIAGETGYGVNTGDPLNLERSRSFALAQVATCRDVAAGTTTWDAVIASDVADGATSAQAQTMNKFLKDEFCPSVRPAPR